MKTALLLSRTEQSHHLKFWRILLCLIVFGFLPVVALSQSQTIVWIENWERTNWDIDWHVDGGTWEVGVPISGPMKSHDGQKCAATVLAGNYSEPANTRLIRHTTFVVPAALEKPRLRFWHWYSFAAGDYGEIQISTDGGVNWTPISTRYTNTSSTVWTYPLIDLSAYAGATVQIAFFFHSHQVSCCGPDVSTGWYIDEVGVIKGEMSFPLTEGFESGIGNWASERGTWEIGIPTSGPAKAFAGQNSAATVLNGNYSEPVDSRLISPQVVIPSKSQNPRLRFWHWYSFSSGDYGEVQIKTKSGPWKTISTAYTNTGSGVWTYPLVDLTAYSDSTVQIGFFFHSHQVSCCGPDVSSGWYIDEITLITGTLVFNPREGFESGLGDWAPERGTWEIGKPASGPNRAFAGQNCAATVLNGNYFEPVDSRLVSPPFLVPGKDQNPRFRFWHWYSFSAGDYGEIQIKKVGEASWQTISARYTNTGSGVWTYPFVDLSNYAGASVQISLFFHSHQVSCCGPDLSAGWYVDEIALITGEIVHRNPEKFEAGIGDWAAERGTWEVGVPTAGPDSAYSPPNCAGTVLGGNYSEPVDSRFISPPVVVAKANQNPALRFRHWYSFSTGDYGELQIKVGNGAWQQIPTTPRFTNTSSNVWTPFFVSLIAYADSTVQVAFNFHAHQVSCCGPDVSTGWYVDDFIITSTIDVVESPTNNVVKSYALHQNYPNPFNPSTTILYELPRSGEVEVAIFNLLGERIRTVVQQHQQMGQYRVQWDGRDEHGEPVPSGVYLYRLQAGEFLQTRKMVLMQ